METDTGPGGLRKRVFRSRRLVLPRWWDRIPASATAISGIAAGGLVAWGLIAVASTQWTHPVPAAASSEAEPTVQNLRRGRRGKCSTPGNTVSENHSSTPTKQFPPRPSRRFRGRTCHTTRNRLRSARSGSRSLKKVASVDPLLLEGQTPDLAASRTAATVKTSVTLRIRVGKDGSVLEGFRRGSGSCTPMTSHWKL